VAGRLKKDIDWSCIRLVNTRYKCYVMVRRAVHQIRRFFAAFKIKRRIEFMEKVANHIASITTCSLLIEHNIYYSLREF